MLALGLDRGDRVAVYLEKRLETIAALFGASAAGGVFVPVNPLLKAEQVAYISTGLQCQDSGHLGRPIEGASPCFTPMP